MIKRLITYIRGKRFAKKRKKVEPSAEQWDKEIYGMPNRWAEVNKYKNTNLPK